MPRSHWQPRECFVSRPSSLDLHNMFVDAQITARQPALHMAVCTRCLRFVLCAGRSESRPRRRLTRTARRALRSRRHGKGGVQRLVLSTRQPLHLSCLVTPLERVTVSVYLTLAEDTAAAQHERELPARDDRREFWDPQS